MCGRSTFHAAAPSVSQRWNSHTTLSLELQFALNFFQLLHLQEVWNQIGVGSEIPAFFLPEHAPYLCLFWENQISLGFQKYLSWISGRIPSWWESAISKKAGNKSPDDTGIPGNCMTPVAKGRPRPSVASLFSWVPSGKDLTWWYSKRKLIQVQWELQCPNFNYQWNQHSVAMSEGLERWQINNSSCQIYKDVLTLKGTFETWWSIDNLESPDFHLNSPTPSPCLWLPREQINLSKLRLQRSKSQTSISLA